MKFGVAKEIEKEVDFFHMSIFYVNVLQHFFYDAKPTKRGWKIIDDNIEYFIERDCNLVLMSDHGIARISAIFYVNKWLLEKGFLRIRSEAGGNLGISSFVESLRSAAGRLELIGILSKLMPESLKKRVAGPSLLDLVDWEKSLAIATGQGSIYLTVDEAHPDYEKNRNLVIDELRLLKNPISGNNVAKAVYRKEEIYHGDFLSLAPDIVFDQADDIYAVSALHPKSVFSPPKAWDAENIRNGIFLAYGEGILRGNKLRTISIVDIAPTILHWLGIPIPEDMDGEVILDIFSEDSHLRNRGIEYQKAINVIYKGYSMGYDEEMAQRLRGLGYLA